MILTGTRVYSSSVCLQGAEPFKNLGDIVHSVSEEQGNTPDQCKQNPNVRLEYD